MNIPKFDQQQAQKYLSIEVVTGAVMIVINDLTQGQFPGPMAFFSLLFVFFLLSLLANISIISTAVVYIGLMFVLTLLFSPTPIKNEALGKLFFDRMANASNTVSKRGANPAHGYTK